MNKLKKILSLAMASLLLGGAVANVGEGTKVDAATTVSLSSFTALSGSLDKVISYSTDKGGGTTSPIVGSGVITLYKPSTSGGTGAYLQITAASPYKISSFTFGWAADKATTTAYSVDNGTVSSNIAVTKSAAGSYTVSSVNCSVAKIFNTGSERMKLASLSVTYQASGDVLTTPSAVLDGNDILIDTVDNASSYKIGFFQKAADSEPLATQDVTIAEAADIYTLVAPTSLSLGKYYLKVRAIGDGTTYSDSAWSDSIGEFVVRAPVKTVSEFVEFTSSSTDYYQVSGTVKTFESATKITITDGTNDLLLYDLKDETNGTTRAKTTHPEISVMDVLTVNIQPDFYNDAIQGKGFLVSIDTNYVVVTFASNGGSEVETQYVVEGSKITQPENPTKTSAIFVGWYSDSQLTNLFDFNSSITEDKTLYAKWNNLGVVDFSESTTKDSLILNYTATTTGSPLSWSLATETSELKVGDRISFAGSANSKGYAMSATQGGSNRTGVEITIANNAFTADAGSINSVGIFEVKAGSADNTFAFYDIANKQYLYASSATANHLKSQNNLDANASWSISITNGIASIKAQGSNTRNVMQFNGGSTLFSCYSSASQSAVSIYKVSGGSTTSYTINSVGLRFGTIVSKDLVDRIASENTGKTIKYGVAVSNTGSDVESIVSRQECEPVRVDENGAASDAGDYYQFALAINNIPQTQWSTNLYGRAYVLVGDDYYYMNEVHHSVQTAALYYVNNLKTREDVVAHVPAINALLALMAA